MLGLALQRLHNLVNAEAGGLLKGTAARPGTPEKVGNSQLWAALPRVKMERGILKRGDSVLRERVGLKYVWIERHKWCCLLSAQCEELEASPSRYTRIGAGAQVRSSEGA